MPEATISLDSHDEELAVFGSRDQYLRQIRDALGVKVLARHGELRVEVRDSGSGFELEAAQRAPEPFFSTRNVGLGLGLTVSRKIIESHHGKIEIPLPRKGEPGVVRVSLPLPN